MSATGELVIVRASRQLAGGSSSSLGCLSPSRLVQHTMSLMLVTTSELF